MSYNFDEIIERKQTHSTKWLKFDDPEIIPMWVADMDFSCPPEILNPLHERIDQGVFGYTDRPSHLAEILRDRLEVTGWDIDPEWVTWIPGAVVGLNVSARTFLNPGDMVMTPSPIYRPFTFAPSNMERGMVKTVMKDVGGRIELDFDSIEALMSSDIKMFYFCNPHNPGGTVFSHEEIERLVNICAKYGVGICSDEIHCDLLLDEKVKHIHTATINDYARENSVTLLGPCKTFNLAGLPIAAAVVPNPELRAHFRRCMRGIVAHISSLSFVATEAAYLNGGEWHKALIEYLKKNKQILIEGINEVEGLSLTGPEASYLAWIDCREAKLLSPSEFIIKQAKVGVHDGEWFGNKDYVRLNFGCPRSVLEDSIARIQKAFSQRN